ncbi:hypothetical protein WHR41_09153 [Cladosporium halotolerans]|uniref:Uncharacterized protein n=1 Tax=Cladosporium halotolerans TaxID=1052096 RepID=A0AB34KEB8_9PEZI
MGFFALLLGAILGVFWMTIGASALNSQILEICVFILCFVDNGHSANHIPLVCEVVALDIRRPNSERSYLFTQLFVGITFSLAGLVMFELRRSKRKWREEASTNNRR